MASNSEVIESLALEIDVKYDKSNLSNLKKDLDTLKKSFTEINSVVTGLVKSINSLDLKGIKVAQSYVSSAKKSRFGEHTDYQTANYFRGRESAETFKAYFKKNSYDEIANAETSREDLYASMQRELYEIVEPLNEVVKECTTYLLEAGQSVKLLTEGSKQATVHLLGTARSVKLLTEGFNRLGRVLYTVYGSSQKTPRIEDSPNYIDWEPADEQVDWEEATDGASEYQNVLETTKNTLLALPPHIEGVSRSLNESAKSVSSLTDKLKIFGHYTKMVLVDAFQKGFDKIKGLFSKFTRILTYRLIRNILRTISEGFTEGVQNLARYSSSFNDLMSKWTTTTLYFKNALGTLSEPLLRLVIPVLEQVIRLTVIAVNHLNEFLAKVQGLDTYTVANPDLSGYWQDYAESLDSASKSANKLKNTLAGFDEINRLNDDNSSNIVDYSKMFKEMTTSIENESEAGQLAMAFKDVFFSFDDLTGEQIFEKIITALGGLVGGVVGFAIGGVPGAIVGTIAGMTLSMLINGVVFNHDGEISGDEILQALIILLGTIAGGVIGFAVGGPVGAAIGMAAGAALTLGLCNIVFNDDGQISSNEVLGSLVGILSTVTGGIIGFVLGGPAGAAIGATLSFALSMALMNLSIDSETGEVDSNKLLTELFKVISSIAIAGLVFTLTSGNLVLTCIAAFKFKLHMDDLFDGRTLSDVVKELKQNWEDGWNKWNADDVVVNAFKNILTNVKAILGIENGLGIIALLNQFADTVSQIFSNLKIRLPHFSWDYDNGIEAKGVFKKALEYFNIPTIIPKLKVDWYATGGFPEDGLFMANHGELVGKFANGRTAVANNEQIEAGIEEAAYRGFTRALSNASMGNNGGNYTFVAEIDGKTLFEEVVTQNNRDARQRGFNRLVTL